MASADHFLASAQILGIACSDVAILYGGEKVTTWPEALVVVVEAKVGGDTSQFFLTGAFVLLSLDVAVWLVGAFWQPAATLAKTISAPHNKVDLFKIGI